MKKGRMGKNSKVLSIAVLIILIVGGVYLISNYSGKVADSNDNLGAVAASLSGQPKAGGLSASTSSVQPVINVTSWPSFNLKYDTSGNEKNLVVKMDYSVTAKSGKIFVPTTWSLMWVKNTLDQHAGNTQVTITPVESISTATCYKIGPCYVIPEGKTVNFTIKQTYDPLQMFSGVYSASFPWFYFSTSKDGDFYFKELSAQTSRLNTVTIVGEKSPYLYTTSLEVNQGDNFILKGTRLTGARPMIEGADNPQIIVQSDSQITISAKLTPGVYRVYMSHPTYGNSNNAWLTVKGPAVKPTVSLVSTSNTLTPGVAGVASSTLTGKITLKIKSNGGVLIKPTASDFSLIFASSTKEDGNYNLSNSIPVSGTVVVTPSDPSVGTGGEYLVEVTGVLASSNIRLGSSQTLFMAISNINSLVDGTVFKQFNPDFHTSAAYLLKSKY